MKNWIIALLMLLSPAMWMGPLGCVEVDLDDDGSEQVEPEEKEKYDD